MATAVWCRMAHKFVRTKSVSPLIISWKRWMDYFPLSVPISKILKLMLKENTCVLCSRIQEIQELFAGLGFAQNIRCFWDSLPSAFIQYGLSWCFLKLCLLACSFFYSAYIILQILSNYEPSRLIEHIQFKEMSVNHAIILPFKI